MLSKKPGPVIGILTGSLISGNKSGVAATSTRATKAHQSPKGLKKSFDFGGVGLGIVAALEKSGDVGRDEFPALFGRNMGRSSPIPVKSCPRNKGASEENEMDSFEEYTIVTCHAPSKSYTKVYCDSRFRIPGGVKSGIRASVFTISPARFGEVGGAPADDFLSSCHLCHKKLQGEDIYMYRGEKAFCSTECRYRQIVMDERKEKYSSEASRSVNLSTSPYTNGQIFTTEILAT